jgi:lambda family phage portal protein
MAIGFKAAENNAYNMSWQVLPEMTPDRELETGNALQTLRRRSRQLHKDNITVAGIQQAIINVVGSPNSVKVFSTNRIQQKQAQEVIDNFLKSSDFEDKPLWQIGDEIISSAVQDGDVLIKLPIDRKKEGVKTVVEVVEANRILTPAEKAKDDNVNHGVRKDSEGRIVSFYVKKHDKVNNYGNSLSSFDEVFRSVKGRDLPVAELFKAPLNSRPRSARQYPLVTPAIPLIKLLDDYLEAVIVGARVAACFSAFIKTNNPAGTFQGFTTDAAGNVVDPQDANGTRRVQKLFPGQIFYLKPNQDITFASPNRPNDNVDAFIVRIQKIIAAYLRIPYPILFLDLSEVNYSSWRGGANEMKKFINRWRWSLERIFEWVLKAVLLEATLLGKVRGDVKDIKFTIRWPSFNILDPEKEARANKTALLNGTTSVQKICEEEGTDYEQVLADKEEHALRMLEIEAKKLAKKKELETKYGIVFDPVDPKSESADGNGKNNKPRPGEGDDLDEDEKKERRKDDGNW